MKKIIKYFTIFMIGISLSGCWGISVEKRIEEKQNSNQTWYILSWNNTNTWSNLSWCDIYKPDQNSVFFNTLNNSITNQKQQIDTWLVVLSWIIFKTKNYDQFSIDIPFWSWLINWYYLDRNDINSWIWNLDLIHISKTDMWTLMSIRLENIYIDATKVDNRFDPIEKYIWWSKYECVYPSLTNSEWQLRTVYYKYWPQTCWDNIPCKWWSDIGMYMIYPISKTDKLVIKIENWLGLKPVYQILLDRMLSSIRIK